MNTYQPYTYLIGWSDLDRWYYGVRYAQNCHPSDFWVNYFTSSRHVKEFREEHGEPDVIQIRNVFDTPEKAILWEERVLTRLKAGLSERWLNQKIGWNGGVPMSDLHRKKISKALTGKPKSDEHKRKNSLARLGSTLKESHKQNISSALKGRSFSAEHRKNLGKCNKGLKRRPETLAKMSDAVKGKKWINNGYEERMSRDLPNGWEYGRLTKCRRAWAF